MNSSHQASPYTPPSSERPARNAYDGFQTFDDRRVNRPIPQGPRASQLVSQFALPTTTQGRLGNGYAYDDSGISAPFRGPPNNRLHHDREVIPDSRPLVPNERFAAAPSSPAIFSQRSEDNSAMDPPTRTDGNRKPVLSLRDSIPSNKHHGEHKVSLKEQMEKYREERLRQMQARHDKERISTYRFSQNSTRSLEKNRNPLLSPPSHASHILPMRMKWGPGSFSQRQYRHHGFNGQSWKAGTEGLPTEPKAVRKESAALPTLKLDTSFGQKKPEESFQNKVNRFLILFYTIADDHHFISLLPNNHLRQIRRHSNHLHQRKM